MKNVLEALPKKETLSGGVGKWKAEDSDSGVKKQSKKAKVLEAKSKEKQKKAKVLETKEEQKAKKPKKVFKTKPVTRMQRQSSRTEQFDDESEKEEEQAPKKWGRPTRKQ